jgi:cyanophycinase
MSDPIRESLLEAGGGPGAFAPLLLLADSQLLFRGAHGPSLLDRARAHLPPSRPARCAYLGAANGEERAFYELFQAAVEAAGLGEGRMVHSRFAADDREWLERADLVVLSGGDVARGWRIFEQSGIAEVLTGRYAAGAVLLGVSAGAVHLGWGHLNLVPAVIGAHEEADDWSDLRRRLAASHERVRGLGIPTGGGCLYHSDGAVEAVRRPLHELIWEEDGNTLRDSLLLPPDEEAGDELAPDEPVN